MRTLSLLSIVLTATALVGCAAQPKPAAKPANTPATEEVAPGLAQRISRICGLAPAQRDAEIAKLKKETGMVLYCGHDQKR